MENSLVNRVEKSGLITLDLAKMYSGERIEIFDLKNFLVNGLMLMEQPFREQLKAHNWEIYKDKIAGIHCSSDALIPMWAYMLVSAYLEPIADEIFFGNKDYVENILLLQAIDSISKEDYLGARVVVKGCGDKAVHPGAFIAITKKLTPVVASIMYGEPCSTVPVYKNAAKK